MRNDSGTVYDTNFIAARQPGEDGLAHMATVRSPKNGLTLELHTSEPGVQFYDAAKLNCPVPGLDGAHYGAHAGLCLEPQVFPTRPTAGISPTACCARTRNTGTSANSALRERPRAEIRHSCGSEIRLGQGKRRS